MSHDTSIPAEWRARSPLMTAEGWQNLQRLRQHPHAPRWNFETGDRLVEGDLAQIAAFRDALTLREALPSNATTPPEWMLDAIRLLRARSWFVEQQLPVGFDLSRDWVAVPTMSRDDLASRITEIVPHDLQDFSRLLAYDTSGTSGHAVVVPHEPRVLAKAHTFAEFALGRHGVSPKFTSSGVGCLNLCAQVNTYVFASVFNVWNQAGFVKANLHESDWAGGREAARVYLPELEAQLVTSDPISLAEAMRWKIALKPKAVLSTALSLDPELRREFEATFECPVLDWYSTTETGPIAFSAADGEGLEILPHDLFLEVLDPTGRPSPEGELGEVVVTCLRNGFLPLIRYRTGDHARLQRAPTPRLTDLQGRAPVFFRAADGNIVSSVDVGRAMRLVATFAQHAFLQRADGSCEVAVRPVSGINVDLPRATAALEKLFGHPVTIHLDEGLGEDGKVIPYRREEPAS